MTRRLRFSHLPTPLENYPALDRMLGAEIWVKRDDVTAGAEAGNKIRKLEFLLGEAVDRRARAVITCGGIQSNHARATALLAARLGLSCTLLLRAGPEERAAPPEGNLLLDRLANARVRFIGAHEYSERDHSMLALAAELGRAGTPAYVIPEGGSNGLGALGYFEAMAEVRRQLDLGLAGDPPCFDAVAVACGSGGTAAGLALGALHWRVADRVLAFAVCDDRKSFELRIEAIVREGGQLLARAGHLPAPACPVDVFDEHKGPRYGVMNDEQLDFLVEVAQKTGLVLDPVYSGKALFGLARLEAKPPRVLFIHTGGLPGLLAQHAVLARRLTASV